ncbi:Mbeg1-like protein [Chimaeribacter californicus]|uniref:Mbeg1-like protein n=1 Tax=Chimaeribacter californicus TaxID=2060067 RepID=UPI0013FD0EAE|nr:Mbeg1-like protein [Chimaeribacter californicus]
MSRLIIATLLLCVPFFSISGDSTRGESGHFWCGERFLGNRGIDRFGIREEQAAIKGYIYVLAAALALQKNNNESNAHLFYKPERMQVIDTPESSPSGFKAITYLIKPLETDGHDEIVIAFTGSDQWLDWKKTNFGKSRDQYNEARNYVVKISKFPKVIGKKIIVSGISLGGALAVHVTKDSLTKNYIKQAWAINPSPKIYAGNDIDKRIWLIYSKGEILEHIRNMKFFLLFKGMGVIGAPENQKSMDYVLVKSNSIYAHYRWVITREVLFVADYALTNRGRDIVNTEPYEILKKSSFRSCKNPIVMSETIDVQS